MKVLYTRGIGNNSPSGLITQAGKGLLHNSLLPGDYTSGTKWAVGLPPLAALEQLLLTNPNPSSSPHALQAYSDLFDNALAVRRAKNFIASTPPPQVVKIGRGVLEPILQGTAFEPFAQDLFNVIAYFESNYKFDAVNSGSGAFGLIQFLPSTSDSLQKQYQLPDISVDTYGLYATAFFGEYPRLLPKVPLVGLVGTTPTDAQGAQRVVRLLTAHRAGFRSSTIGRLDIQKDLAIRVLAFIGKVCQRILFSARRNVV